jgi:hypothetical protein
VKLRFGRYCEQERAIIDVPPEALIHLVGLASGEIGRLEAIEELCDLRDEPEPEGFDRNDIPIYQTLQSDLSGLRSSGSTVLDLGSSIKFAYFLTMIIPAYVTANRAVLTDSELEALRAVDS